MTESNIEQRIRSGLRITRFVSTYLPLSIARWVIDKSLARTSLPDGFSQESVIADGVPCVWLIPPDSSQDHVLFYLHGGGFIYGLTTLHLEMVAYLAQQMGVRALLVDYRLAPDFPFPAALDDCVTAYEWLLKQGVTADNIAIAGDSAGGNLTLTSMMALRDKGVQLPVAAACLSPVADMTNKQEAFEQVYDDVLHPRAVKFMHRSYVADTDPRDPMLSPVFGDWRGLPPLLLHAGEDEILCEDSVCVDRLASSAGVETRLEIYPHMWHVWQVHLALPQTKQSLHDIAGFLCDRLQVG